MENQLNTKLIGHGKNSFQLTDGGRITFTECSVIFGAIENLKANISRAGTVLSRTLKIAATNSIALTALSPAINEISKKHPELVVQLKLGNSDQVKEYLRTQEAELGFILEDDEMDEFDYNLVKEGQFLLVASPKKLFKDLSKLIITRQNKVEIKHLKKKLGPDIRFHMEVFSWELIRQLCVEGAGIGYIPDYLIQDDLKKKKLQIIKPDLKIWKYKLVAIQMKKRILSSASQAFLEQSLVLNLKA